MISHSCGYFTYPRPSVTSTSSFLQASEGKNGLTDVNVIIKGYKALKNTVAVEVIVGATRSSSRVVVVVVVVVDS